MASYAFISYLKADPAGTMKHVITALGLPHDQLLLRQSIEAGSFANMKKLGASPAYADTPIAPADKNNPNAAKVRSAGSEPTHIFDNRDLDYIAATIDTLFLHKEDRVYRTLIQPSTGGTIPRPSWMTRNSKQAATA